MVGLLSSDGKAVECNLRPLAPDTDQYCEKALFEGFCLFIFWREFGRCVGFEVSRCCDKVPFRSH